MANFNVSLDTMTIAASGTDSNIISGLGDAKSILICGPSALTGTVTISVSPTDGTASDFVTLQSAGSDITIGAVKGVLLTNIAWKRMKMVSGSAEAAARAFLGVKQIY